MEAKRYGTENCQRIKCMKYYLIYKTFDSVIDRIFDYKGDLEVYWNIKPSEEQMRTVADYWFDLFGEPCTTHKIIQEVEYKKIVL